MGWAHTLQIIPMVNETDATPVKISDTSLFPFSSCDLVFGYSLRVQYSLVALSSFNVKDRVEGYDGNGIWYKHRALYTGQWP
jgi:hypothetical protein